MTSPATTETLTDRMILDLSAGSDGDVVMGHICRVALGEQEPVVTGEEYEERYGGGGFTREDELGIRRITSMEQARRLCAEAITEGRSMDDESDFVAVVA